MPDLRGDTYQPCIPSTGQKAILDEISHHKNVIVQLKRDYNALSPISRLFPELVAELLRVYRSEMDAEYRDGVKTRTDDPPPTGFEWLNVLHVCHHWRTIAMDDPHFWTHIVATPGMDKGIMNTLLERSKNLPISVVYHLSYQDTDETIPILAAQTARIRHLTILQYVGVNSVDYFFDAFARSSEVLESIELDFCRRDMPASPAPGAIQGDTRVELPIDVPMFAGHTPNLRTVKITLYAVPMPNPFFCASVSHLELHYLRYFIAEDAEGLISSLKMVPLLQTIILVHAIPPALTDLAVPRSPVPLPEQLRRLVISDDIPQILALLAQVHVPAMTSVHLVIYNNASGAGPDPRRLREVIPSFLDGTPKVATIVSPHVDDSEPHWKRASYTWRCWWGFAAAPAGAEPFLNTSRAPILDGLRLCLECPELARWELCDVVPAAAVETVSLRAGSYEPHIARKDSDAMAFLRELHVYGVLYCGAVVDVLGWGWGGDVFVPSLRVLRIYEARLEGEGGGVSVADLVGGLRRRREEGFADLDEVSFERCAPGVLEACQLEPIRELVGHLWWDDTVVSCDHDEPVEPPRIA